MLTQQDLSLAANEAALARAKELQGRINRLRNVRGYVGTDDDMEHVLDAAQCWCSALRKFGSI